MGADIKLLRSRMKSVDSTLHLTSAMGLVASSKIRRAGDNMLRGREYAGAVGDMIKVLVTSRECARSPYMNGNSSELSCTVVIAGDRGLAGGYNANVLKLASEFSDSEIVAVGKRACERFGHGYLSAEKFSFNDAKELSVRLCRDFLSGKYSRISIVYTKYVSMLTQEASALRLLPLERRDESADGSEISGHKASVIFEPGEQEVLDCAVPEYVAGMIYACTRESFASEVAARRMAMDSAEKNAKEMLSDLTLSYNRARQGAITQEITEIVAGSES